MAGLLEQLDVTLCTRGQGPGGLAASCEHYSSIKEGAVSGDSGSLRIVSVKSEVRISTPRAILTSYCRGFPQSSQVFLAPPIHIQSYT